MKTAAWNKRHGTGTSRFSFGKRDVFRLHLNESRESFCQRGRERSFHVGGVMDWRQKRCGNQIQVSVHIISHLSTDFFLNEAEYEPFPGQWRCKGEQAEHLSGGTVSRAGWGSQPPRSCHRWWARYRWGCHLRTLQEALGTRPASLERNKLIWFLLSQALSVLCTKVYVKSRFYHCSFNHYSPLACVLKTQSRLKWYF